MQYMFDASGVSWIPEYYNDTCVFFTTGSEPDGGKEAFQTFAIYYLHKPESL